MYSIFVGNQKSLVFPVMCNGFITIDYSDNIADTDSNNNVDDDVPYGIWKHEGDFTFEAVITPYEINGYQQSKSSADLPTIPMSKKFLPAIGAYNGNVNHFQSHKYLTTTQRLTHEMALFFSTNLQIYLVNETAHSQNNPARYKIKVVIKLGTNTETFTTPVVIEPNSSKFFKYTSAEDLTGLNADGRIEFRKVGQTTALSGNNINLSSTNLDITEVRSGGGQRIFLKNQDKYVDVGEHSALSFSSGTWKLEFSSSTINALSADIVSLINSGCEVFVKNKLDPNYVNDIFHIGCSFGGGVLDVFLNGGKIFTGTTTSNNEFKFAREDLFIGANGQGTTGVGSASTNKQFMGELHEMSFIDYKRNSFPSINSLMPNFDNTLFYFRFEEVDA